MIDNDLWESLISVRRLFDENPNQNKSWDRSEFDRDHDRIVFSHYFRRLHDKTQVFPYSPLSTSSQARSRLSHSLEVSCAGRTLGTKLGFLLNGLRVDVNPYHIGSIIASACLAHDIGNPPFGHSGEDAMRSWTRKNLNGTFSDRWEESDLFNFEGNAQGFRILSRIENWQRKGGLRPTVTTIGAFMKYPNPSHYEGISCGKFGYYKDDFESAEYVFGSFSGIDMKYNNRSFKRHPFAFLSEAADDICYAIIDMEDAFHLGLIGFDEYSEMLMPIAMSDPGFKDDESYDKEIRIARIRSSAINTLIEQSFSVFHDNIIAIEKFEFKYHLIDLIKNSTEYKAIVEFSIDNIYNTARVLEIECAGFQALGGLLDIFVNAVLSEKNFKKDIIARKLIPEIYFKRHDIHYNKQIQYDLISQLTPYQRVLAVSDYICGMTDRHAIELYQTLSGIKLPLY